MTPTPGNDELERQLEQERADRARDAQQPAGDPGDEQPDEAEADDEPEADDEADDDDETEVDEPKAVKEISPEAQARKLGRIVDSFELELRELFAVDEPLTPLSMDGAIGFMFPGMLEVKPNEQFKACRTCNGHGQVLTGSLAEGKQTADCPRCKGLGYLIRDETPTAANGVEPSADNADDPDAGFSAPTWMGDTSIRPVS